jgi:hypothetical protein
VTFLDLKNAVSLCSADISFVNFLCRGIQSNGVDPMGKEPDQFSEKEAMVRFEAALKGALSPPHEQLEEKPKVRTKKPSSVKKRR